MNQPGVTTVYAFTGEFKPFSFVGTIAELAEALIPAIQRRGTRDQA